MLGENFLLRARRRGGLFTNERRHDLAQDGGVIFGLRLAGRGLDAKALEVAAQARQRPLVEETRQIVGGVGQELAAAEADEEIKVFAPDLGLRDTLGGIPQRGMREA